MQRTLGPEILTETDRMRKKKIFVGSRVTPKWPCPDCGAVHDAITGIAEDRSGLIPTVGSISVCVYCARLLRIGEGGYELANLRDLLRMAPYQRKVLEMAIRKIGRKRGGIRVR